MTTPLVELGRVLEQVTRVEQVDPARFYPMLGVRSFGRGAFSSGVLPGSETQYKSLKQVKKDDLVYPKLMAWEGAFAVVPQELDGRFVSPEFCTFWAAPDQLSPRYMAHLFAWSNFVGSLGRGATGTNVRRQRLQPRQLLATVVPLPALSRQRQIAARLDSLIIASESQIAQSKAAERTARILANSLFDDSFEQVPVKELVTETKRLELLLAEEEYRTAGIRWYADGLFAREAKLGRDIGAKQLNRLTEGELIYNRLFAWKGSFALTPLGALYASNEFPTFRIDERRVLPEFLLGWLSQPRVWADIDRLSTGATPTSRNRLKQAELLNLAVSLPPLAEQRHVVEILKKLERIRSLNQERERLAVALSHAARNSELSALLI